MKRHPNARAIKQPDTYPSVLFCFSLPRSRGLGLCSPIHISFHTGTQRCMAFIIVSFSRAKYHTRLRIGTYITI